MVRNALFATLGLLGAFLIVEKSWAEADPFAAGEDALAVKATDGSASVRAKLKANKMAPDMVMVRVRAVDDSQFPNCVVTAQVLRDARSKAKHFRLLGRGKVYRFAPKLRTKRGQPDLSDPVTRANLGACYYPPRSTLVFEVSGVDLKRKVFEAGRVYLK